MCGVVRYSVFYSGLLVLFFFWSQSLLSSGSSGLCGFSFFRGAMVSFSFCISSLKLGWACFGVSRVFEVCAPVDLLVWIGEERTAEAVSCQRGLN